MHAHRKRLILLSVVFVGLLALYAFLLLPRPNNESSIEVRAAAWATFDAYRNVLEVGDVSLLEPLSYRLSPTCSNEEMVEECKLRMQAVYDLVKDFNRDQFSEVWYDEKQILLFTPPQRNETEEVVSYERSYIYFTRDLNGNPRILAIDPKQVWSFTRAEKEMSDEDIEREIEVITIDIDQDGIPDIYEVCAEGADPTLCMPTDPEVRDTNGDGWWDGFQQYIEAYDVQE